MCIGDKHDQAYTVLLTERSKRIEQLYHGLSDWKSAEPERDLLCLKCHVHPNVERQPMHVADGTRSFRFEDGVSCEACHGPAGRWLDLHHRPEWKTLSATSKRDDFGMEGTHSLPERIKMCLACHVGAPGMEVNHDLLAAGHPRLAFEFTSSHAILNHHWDDADDRDPALGGSPDFEARAWIIGQVLTFEASLDLFEHRLSRPGGPEFAEYDCYACHHDLKVTGDRQDRAFPGRVAGRLTWNRWASSQVENAVEFLTGAKSPVLANDLQAIREEMTRLQPDRKRLAESIRGARTSLPPISIDRPVPSVRPAVEQIARTSTPTWDDAAQAYNGLVAWERTRIDRRQPEIPGLRSELSSLRRLLTPDARYRIDDARAILDRVAR